jgi:tetratricopeptide (TPR) repeat protein
MNSIRIMALACGLFAAACTHAASGQAVGAPLHRNGQTKEELVERGRAFAMIGDLTRGEQYLSAALRRGADPCVVLPLLVHVCVEAGRYRVAAEYLRMYMIDNPESANMHLLYGSLEAAVGDREVAQREYERLLRSHPDDSTGHYALAVLFRDAVGDRSASDAHFREYLRLAPYGEHATEARASLLDEAR